MHAFQDAFFPICSRFVAYWLKCSHNANNYMVAYRRKRSQTSKHRLKRSQIASTHDGHNQRRVERERESKKERCSVLKGGGEPGRQGRMSSVTLSKWVQNTLKVPYKNRILAKLRQTHANNTQKYTRTPAQPPLVRSMRTFTINMN